MRVYWFPFPRQEPELRVQVLGCSCGFDPNNGYESTDPNSLLWHSRPFPPLLSLPPAPNLPLVISLLLDLT